MSGKLCFALLCVANTTHLAPQLSKTDQINMASFDWHISENRIGNNYNVDF